MAGALQAIHYERGKLEILDQLQLPTHSEYIPVQNTEDGWDAIKQMKVRGAPAIAIVGCLSLAVELYYMDFKSRKEIAEYVSDRLKYLVTARPTAVNMDEAATKISSMIKDMAEESDLSINDFKELAIEAAEIMFEDDVTINKDIGFYGAEHIISNTENLNVRILTHCNTGSLATAGYGTALGIVRALHERGKIDHVYCTETRPYNQGARLTAYELVHENISATLILDSMPSMLMAHHDVTAVVVGADRVVANGDTANKIGTLQLAIVAKYFNVPFYVACPVTTFDSCKASGKEIEIEERPHHEMVSIKGQKIAAEGINCWNPAFDVTPAELITGGIVTEFGVFKPSEIKEKLASILSENKKNRGPGLQRRSSYSSLKNAVKSE
ncbi:methylthioribose-1-phosphate isomerase isoform X1 [Patella vulgata]|uniref:methylthioribose-1-phosphate isomerase isoform X1 n=2 Tax=Patella vulgata TaxID=6465 RepID=UPI0024A99EA2|nr:methylthioribose-1-phosphate isomerase isoform X1 [Patella vulgata]